MVRIITCILLSLGLCGCGHKGAEGTVEICYTLNETERVVPSYQTVIWLEDGSGKIVKSLLVSEYLSIGGYSKEQICSAWSSKSGWAKKKMKDVAAVTKATPKIGEHVLKVDCRAEGIAAGDYMYFVQTHIAEDFNILYSGEITVGGEENRSIGEVTHTPEKHDRGAGALSDVRARYYR